MLNKKMSLNLKIGGGFALVLFFLILLGIISYSGFRGLIKNEDKAISSLNDNYFITQKLVDHLKWQIGLDDLFLSHKEFTGQLDPKRCGFGKWYYSFINSSGYQKLPEDIKKTIDDMEGVHIELHNSGKKIINTFQFFDENITKRFGDVEIAHLNWMNELLVSILNREKFSGQTDHTKCAFGEWYYQFMDSEGYEGLSSNLKVIFKDIGIPHENLHKSGKKILENEIDGNYSSALKIYFNELTPTLKELQGKIYDFRNELEKYSQKNDEAKKIFNEETVVHLGTLQNLFSSYANYLSKNNEQSLKKAKFSERITLILLVITIIFAISLGSVLAFFITRGITSPLMNISKELKDSSGQIASASTQLSASSQHMSTSSQSVSSTSQQIASGASEQASSIEETTSSVEEITSMVKQNVGNAKEASNLSDHADELSEKGYFEMENMLESMKGINRSSEEIGKVIKIIDDIAFQTNILALNAAVEAARAGEAGMGFAVVADEVKNLANKSLEAAKDTASMIGSSIEKSQSGLTIANNLLDIFKNIRDSVKKVNEVAKEVEVAGDEQERGLEQVGKAIIQLDNVVQDNASSAEEMSGSAEILASTSEETASSAEELLSQAESLNRIVSQLVYIVTGKEDYIEKAEEKVEIKVNPKIESELNEIKREYKMKKIAGKEKRSNEKKDKGTTEISPEQVIPFESDEDFGNV